MTPRTRRDRIGQAFGLVINRLRLNKGWATSVLARRAGMSESYLRLVQHGQSMPTLLVIIELAEVLDVTPAELVRMATEVPAPPPQAPDPPIIDG